MCDLAQRFSFPTGLPSWKEQGRHQKLKVALCCFLAFLGGSSWGITAPCILGLCCHCWPLFLWCPVDLHYAHCVHCPRNPGRARVFTSSQRCVISGFNSSHWALASWMATPPKWTNERTLEPVNGTYLEKVLFANKIKLKIFRWEHPRLHRWAMYPSALTRNKWGKETEVKATWRRRQSGAMQPRPRSRRRQTRDVSKGSPWHSGGSTVLWHQGCRLPAPGTVEELISRALNHQVHGNISQKP